MRKVVCGVLAEQTRNVAFRRDQAAIDGGWDDHFDNRLAAPPVQPCLAISTVHVAEAWREDNSSGVMIIRRASGQSREARELRECDVHSKRCGMAAVGVDPL